MQLRVILKPDSQTTDEGHEYSLLKYWVVENEEKHFQFC